MASEGAELGGFLETAGRSLGNAQRQLAGAREEAEAATGMAISEVEIEVKATLESIAGEVEVRPLSSREARAAVIPGEMISTLRVRFVAIADELPGSP